MYFINYIIFYLIIKTKLFNSREWNTICDPFRSQLNNKYNIKIFGSTRFILAY